MADENEPSLAARIVVDRMLDVVEAQHAMRELSKLDPRIVAAKRAGVQLKLTRTKHLLARGLDDLAKSGEKPTAI